MSPSAIQRGPENLLGKYDVQSEEYSIHTDVCRAVDFALTEAAYTVFCILQRFPGVKLPPNEKVELLGVEKQKLTLVLSPAEGCNVEV